jgi:hypothetical protein
MIKIDKIIIMHSELRIQSCETRESNCLWEIIGLLGIIDGQTHEMRIPRSYSVPIGHKSNKCGIDRNEFHDLHRNDVLMTMNHSI